MASDNLTPETLFHRNVDRSFSVFRQEFEMADQMTLWERVRATLTGGDIDRPPISMWRHFPSQESTAQGLADAMIGFQNEYDWDFVKINPRASYHGEDWGLKLRFGESGLVGQETVDWPVKSPGGWSRIERLDPTVGALGEQLRAVELYSGSDGRRGTFADDVVHAAGCRGPAGRQCGRDVATDRG